MGLVKWMLRHNPGGPGSIAKSMAREYRAICGGNPKLSKQELIQRCLESRWNRIPSSFTQSSERRRRILEQAGTSLVHLVIATWIAEGYEGGGNQQWITAPERFRRQVIEVIREIVVKEVPDQTAYPDPQWTFDFEESMGFYKYGLDR